MGHDRFSTTSYSVRSLTYAGKSTDQVFTSHTLNEGLDPKKIQFRESRDSEANPVSTPIILGLDVTGSMGFIADSMIRSDLGKLIRNLYEAQPVTDPHVMLMGIGDSVAGDAAPLQATQFESSDTAICDQLEQLWLVKGGGGNHYEGYDLAWAFAASKTESDAWDKRRKKGYLFTIGDEQPPKDCDYGSLGLGNHQLTTPMAALAAAQERYNVFHVIVEEGSYCRGEGRRDVVYEAWQSVLGPRALRLQSHGNISTLIAAAIALEEGTGIQLVMEGVDDSIRAEIQRGLGA